MRRTISLHSFWCSCRVAMIASLLSTWFQPLTSVHTKDDVTANRRSVEVHVWLFQPDCVSMRDMEASRANSEKKMSSTPKRALEVLSVEVNRKAIIRDDKKKMTALMSKK